LVWRQDFGPAVWLELARPGTLAKLLQHFEYEDSEDGRRSSGTKRQKIVVGPRTSAVLTPDHTRSNHRPMRVNV